MCKEKQYDAERGMELLKVVPMVGTMFLAYEYMKDLLQVRARIL